MQRNIDKPTDTYIFGLVSRTERDRRIEQKELREKHVRDEKKEEKENNGESER